MRVGLIDAAQDVRRLSEIAGILLSHGFGDLIRQLGIEKIAASVHRSLHPQNEAKLHALSAPERLRLALEELGPTFVKLGQVLSTRADLLPPDYITELGCLRDKVGTIPWDDLVTEVEDDLGCPLTEQFGEIEFAPLAAGSIAQVHPARLKIEEEVILCPPSATMRQFDQFA